MVLLLSIFTHNQLGWWNFPFRNSNESALRFEYFILKSNVYVFIKWRSVALKNNLDCTFFLNLVVQTWKFTIQALLLGSMEIEPHRESLTMTERGIREWREKKESIEKTVTEKKIKESQRKCCEGAGRKPSSEKLNKFVLEWFHERRSKGLRVSRKLNMKKIFHDDMVK